VVRFRSLEEPWQVNRFLLPNNPLRGEQSVPQPRAFWRSCQPTWFLLSTSALLDTLRSRPAAKVDRRALPPPEADLYFKRGVTFALYLDLRTVGRSGLRVQESVGYMTILFELGGHSLLSSGCFPQFQAPVAPDPPI